MIYYAVNGEAFYQRICRNSILSLRHFSTTTPVTVAVFGPILKPLKEIESQCDVRLVPFSEVPLGLGTSVKWLGLQSVKNHENIMFVDADTCFMASPEDIMTSHSNKMFYARRETATAGGEWLGKTYIPMRIDTKKMKVIRKKYLSKHLPIFNSSVMIFNHGFHREIISRLPTYAEIFAQFVHNRRIYPSRRWGFAEEVVATIVLGMHPTPSWGFLNAESVTHYKKWVSEDRGEIGSIMHIGNNYIIRWLNEFGEHEEMAKIKAILAKIRPSVSL